MVEITLKRTLLLFLLLNLVVFVMVVTDTGSIEKATNFLKVFAPLTAAPLGGLYISDLALGRTSIKEWAKPLIEGIVGAMAGIGAMWLLEGPNLLYAILWIVSWTVISGLVAVNEWIKQGGGASH